MAARRIATAITDGCTAPCASERNRPSRSASWGIVLFDAVLLVVGLAILAPAADQFVLGSARLSAVLNLPPVVIGTAVMGFGTSVPEMIVSSIAASGGDRALGVGNIFTTGTFDVASGTGTQTVIDCQGPALLCSDIENGSTAFYEAGGLSVADDGDITWGVDVVIDLGGTFGIADSTSSFTATPAG